MADITISDLELAPALADDMVLAVENTTDTYAATLAMLRRLINKTFVEVENADFNALTDDGFYQCTGTPTNSPVAGAINWTLQVSAESGVVVQRAFSLDDSFANMYIRRWNGVTWTGWLEVGAGALANKANVSNTVTTDTAQTITGAKNFQDGGSIIYARNTSLASNSTIPSSNILIGGFFTQAADGSLTGGFYSQTETTSQKSYSFARKRINGTEKTAWASLQILNDGTMFATAPTPPAGSVGGEIVTAGWFRQSGCTARTVIETYRSGANFYRVWSDGWIEQGGIGGTSPTVNFLKSFDTTDYTLIAMGRTTGTAYPMCEVVANRTKTSFYMASTTTTTFEWYACGY